eukprot:1798449-Alexandrium_andersonii.AAC.1
MVSAGIVVPRGTGSTLMPGATTEVFPRVPSGMVSSWCLVPRFLAPMGSCCCCRGDACRGRCCCMPALMVPTGT